MEKLVSVGARARTHFRSRFISHRAYFGPWLLRAKYYVSHVSENVSYGFVLSDLPAKRWRD